MAEVDLRSVERYLRSINKDLNNSMNAMNHHLEQSLHTVNHNITAVQSQIATMEQKIEDTGNVLEMLAEEFREYVRKDMLMKNVQLAETRLVKVRQELENKYGHYEEVRRRAIGILQAVDSQLVRKETFVTASEEQLLAVPRYWLAPCLVALSAWLNDDKPLAEKAIVEALQRDDEKTSLFFALVTRRGGRYQSSRRWLERYFGQQDPNELNREIVILIDGFSNGIFGPDARSKCGLLIKGWIDEISQKTGFVEEQREQWKNALLARKEKLPDGVYPYLQKYSSTWPVMAEALQGAKLHHIIFQYFNFVLLQEIIPTKNLVSVVDELLDVLVREFDAEELPLRQQERWNDLIVTEDGDEDGAHELFDNEKVLEEKVDFTQLLTNFAMYPQQSKASVATQKLAIALSKDWIIDAHKDLTAEIRNGLPLDIEITLDTWTGTSRDGSNEEMLVQDLEAHIEEKKKQALLSNAISLPSWIMLVLSIVFIFMGSDSWTFRILSIVCALIFVFNLISSKLNVKVIHEEYEKMFENNKQILLATLSDIVDFRREYEEEDAKADAVSALISQVTPEQYTYSTYDPARAIIS